MKIEQVKVILTSPNQNYLFVKLITDSGVYGVGDASLNGQEHTCLLYTSDAADE